MSEIGERGQEKLLLRMNEAAEILSISRSKLFQLVRRGDLPVVRIDRATRIPLSSLRAWVERLSGESKNDQPEP